MAMGFSLVQDGRRELHDPLAADPRNRAKPSDKRRGRRGFPEACCRACRRARLARKRREFRRSGAHRADAKTNTLLPRFAAGGHLRFHSLRMAEKACGRDLRGAGEMMYGLAAVRHCAERNALSLRLASVSLLDDARDSSATRPMAKA